MRSNSPLCCIPPHVPLPITIPSALHSARSRDSTVGTASRLRAGRSGVWVCRRPRAAEAPPVSYWTGTGTTAGRAWSWPLTCNYSRGLDWVGCLLYVPPGLTYSNATLCPHSVFMCFVWVSEQTAIISLYSINWLVYITETECVYCAVRTLYTARFNIHNSYFLPTQCIYVFCVDLRTNSDYFPIQH
jgi:hypothetical protein